MGPSRARLAAAALRRLAPGGPILGSAPLQPEVSAARCSRELSPTRLARHCGEVASGAPSSRLASSESKSAFVFTRHLRAGTQPVRRGVVGDRPGDRTASGLWSSDHAGGFAFALSVQF